MSYSKLRLLAPGVAGRFVDLVGRSDLIAGVDEDSDRQRHFFLGDQVVEHRGDAEIAMLVDIGMAILKHHHARRLAAIVLFRNVDPIVAHRVGKHVALPLVLGDDALRHAVMPLGIGPQRVDLWC